LSADYSLADMTADFIPAPPHPGQAAPQMTAAEAFSQARAAFLQGDYRRALRLANFAEVGLPQNARLQELISLALFALGDYPAAAGRAHAALALGPPSDWPGLYGYYNDVAKYSAQLRKLEKTVADAHNSAPSRFLLGYHYLMIGAQVNAKHEFSAVGQLTPDDKLAEHILTQLQAGQAITPPESPRNLVGQKGMDL
jgi:tetratricopeptide (TPR) repeat protein